MAGGHEVGAKRLGLGQERIELDELVAAHAGVWRSAAAVFLDEVVDDVAAERIAEVDDVVRHAEHRADAAGILDRAQRTTSVFALDDANIFALGPDVQRDADDAMSLAREQRGGHRAVDATAHPDQDC